MIKFSGQTTGGGGGAVPDASETVKGKIRIATSAEATTGTNDLIAMTPKTVTDLIDAAVLGLFDYKGALDASQPTTPDISSGLKGDFYRISVAGTIYGKTWAINDALVINADMGGVVDNAKIDKFDNTDAVTSVNTQTGAVVLDTADVAENTNLYYTDGRVDTRAATLPLSTLSDVDYTGGAGIDGDVLTWVNASSEWQAVTPATAPVSSVNTQTGAVVLDTADVAENTNLYYTDGRVDTEVATLPLTTLSDVTYTAGAGIDGKVLTYVHGSTEWQAVTPATAPVSSVNTQTGAVVLDTADVAENTNLYYTDGRVDAEVATLPLTTLSDVDYTAGAGIDGKVLTYVHASTEWQAVTPATAPVTSVNTQTGAVVLNTSNIAENTNLYYTDGRVDSEVATLPLSTLSDVDYTAGAGIDGKVLTYVHASTEWQAVTPASGGLAAVVNDTTPQLGGDLDVNSHSIVSVLNGDIELAPNGTGIIKTTGSVEPDANLTRSIGTEALRYVRTYSDVDGAIIFKGKNDSGVTLTKGQAVYVKGVSGTVPTVDKARANNASTMPAFGLVYADANDQAEVQIVTFGNLTDVNTTTYSLSLGDTVYISAATAGALTNTAPASETNLIQNIGRVIRADASAGIIKVGGAGRSNATPNLDLDKIFVGNATHQTVSKSLSAIGLTELNQNLTTATVSENTNLYYTDGRVDARAATLPLSTLSDVSYTAGAGIDGRVLTYVHASAEWQAVTPASGGAGWTYSAITSASSPVTAAVDYHYGASTSGGVITFNLPAVSGTTSGEQIRIKLNVAGNNLNVTPNGSDNIDGVGSAYALSIALSSITLVSDGSTNWEIV